MAEEGKTLIRFDWAMKKLLRDKANFDILEGFLTTLLNKEVKIERMLESESNQEDYDTKYNRVDILAESTDGEKMLIEVQSQSEVAYFHRMLFGTARLISEYTKLGETYGKISKIYSINIVYFNIGEGDDSVYVGQTEFRGLHKGDILRLSQRWKKRLKVNDVKDIFPEYYILRVGNFDKWSETPLDQWMYFLSQGALEEKATAPGMEAVKAKLQYEKLSKEEKIAYRKKLDDQISIRNGYNDALSEGIDKGRELGIEEGREIGLAEGRAEGLAKGKLEGASEAAQKIAENMMALGISPEDIERATGIRLT